MRQNGNFLLKTFIEEKSEDKRRSTKKTLDFREREGVYDG